MYEKAQVPFLKICGQEGQWYAGVLWEECGQQVKGGDPLPLFSPLVSSSGLPQYKTDKELLERVHWRVTRMMWGQENVSYEERLCELGLFSLENFEREFH